jgi:hypothetical protein
MKDESSYALEAHFQFKEKSVFRKPSFEAYDNSSMKGLKRMRVLKPKFSKNS